jgi:AcrR family transcriptional regulator
MEGRLTRTERNTQNRERILAAARRVFLERGYYGATLEQIAEEAGFTKGAVYSRFEGKADLFLALLEDRIAERARENIEVTEGVPADRVFTTLFENFIRVNLTEPEWPLLVIEFRVHAGRDEELNRRYAALHERTIDALADLLASLYERTGDEMLMPPRQMGELVMAMGSGIQLERAASPDALGGELIAELLTELLVQRTSGVRQGSAA